jgi:hypothetical protein
VANSSITVQRLGKSFAPKVKEIRYLNKTFPQFRQNLIDFAKVYFPDTYKDFNETSPGMMFIELASYVGDVLSYYIDTQFRENLVNFAQEPQNIIHIAQAFGFKPKPSAAARTTADVFQLVPSQTSASSFFPDERFYLRIAPNSVFSSDEFGSVNFRNIQEINFGDPQDRQITVFAVDGNNNPQTYLVKKTAILEAGDIKTTTATFGDPERFAKITIPDQNVLGVLKIVDSNGNEWSEVDYLAQDVIIDDKDNVTPVTGSSISLPPRKIIKFKREPRRFITRYNDSFQLEIIFGSGVLDDTSELVSLDASKIASEEFQTRISSTPLDPADFLSSTAFGLAPAHTTLTITYVVGGGLESNVPSNTINKVRRISVLNDRDVFLPSEQSLFDDIVKSFAVNNPEPATGGKGADSVEEIRQNTLAFFNSQNRLVTAEDYIARVHAMPSRFGSVAKAFVIEDDQLNAVNAARLSDIKTAANLPTISSADQFVLDNGKPRLINLYVLGFDQNKKLVTLNDQTKMNLKQYLSAYKILTDEIQILDAFVVNIGVNFKVAVFKSKNVNEVLANCLDAVKDFFNIDRWDINQPIIMNDLFLQIASVEGVQSVVSLEIVNKYAFKDGGDYSNLRYDIQGNALDVEKNIVFPSLDPMIFELRFPDTDIVGSAVQ